jgi:thiamine-monophosphate kinase
MSGTGEFELIAEIRERARRAGVGSSERLHLGSGDDAAVSVPGAATATSTDAIVEGVHFRLGTATPREIGAKAISAALSDLAAMGAAPGEAYVQLGLPASFADESVLELADGMIEVAARTGTAIAGGDIVGSGLLFVSVTVVGHAASSDAFVTRSGSRAGEEVFVTGELGGAAAGLRVLERPELGEALDPAVAEHLRARQLRPVALLEAGAALAAAGASAMIDISDGLAGDARHLAEAGGVRIDIEAARIPVEEGVAAVAESAGVDQLELILGGEDYELLVVLAQERKEAAVAGVAATGTRLTPIGYVSVGQGFELAGATAPERLQGHQHRR